MDFPGEFAVGFHVWLDSGLVVVVRADQVQKSNGLRRRPDPSDNTSERALKLQVLATDFVFFWMGFDPLDRDLLRFVNPLLPAI